MKKLYVPFFLFLFAGIYCANAQTLRPDFYITNGQVNAIAQSGSTVYIGGNFSYVGPNNPNGTVLSAATGAPNLAFPRPNGPVVVSIPDGAGGWYIGGSFTKVGNSDRNYLARINADGTVHPWNPNPNISVTALALNANTLYVGGSFTTIGGQPRNGIAAFNITTGNVTGWNPNGSGYVNVYTIVVDGSTVYVGGSFTSLGGQSRNNLAALDVTTGNATAWNPGANNVVYDLVLSGATLYAGGGFSSIGGQTRNYIAALDLATGNATAWNPGANSTVLELAVNDNSVYAVGYFTFIGGQSRSRLAALDRTTGNATAFNPSPNWYTITITLQGNTLYAGGEFAYIGGQSRSLIAALDATTGNASSWTAGEAAAGTVRAIGTDGTNVYVGGQFASIGGKARGGLAALDATTGTVKNWSPSPAGVGNTVHALAVNGSTVYAAGQFNQYVPIGGQIRLYLAALDATTGNATSWNPNTSGGHVQTLLADGNTVYVGGGFTSIGGQSRNSLAALDVATGNATAWNPNVTGNVRTMVRNGNTLYIGGNFSAVGGQNRKNIAAVNMTTGSPTAFNPDANADVYALAVNNSTVFAGGFFSTIGSQSKNYLAALDASSGDALSWDVGLPNQGGNWVYALALSGNTLYVGGNFTQMSGQICGRLASLDATTGNLLPWNPLLDDAVTALNISGTSLLAGGNFTAMGSLYPGTGIPQPKLAAFTIPAVLPVHLLSFTAQKQNSGQVVCNWATAGEQNSDYFVVERSRDAKDFTALGRVAAAGNTTSAQSYRYTDNSPLSGAAYYRLKQVDRDGAAHYSAVVLVSGTGEQGSLALYPNPVRSEATLAISLSQKSSVRYTIHDQSGKMVLSGLVVLPEGFSSFPLPAQGLAKGVYTVRVQAKGVNRQVKLLKQ